MVVTAVDTLGPASSPQPFYKQHRRQGRACNVYNIIADQDR